MEALVRKPFVQFRETGIFVDCTPERVDNLWYTVEHINKGSL
jgi:hypothetical protein